MKSSKPEASAAKLPRFTAPISFLNKPSWLNFVRFCFVYLALFTTIPPCDARECVDKFDPTHDYFPDKALISHADDFLVNYTLNYKVVRNVGHEVYILTMCGTPQPARDEIPAELLLPDDSLKFFTIPFEQVAIDSGVVSSYLELLGDRITIRYIDLSFLCSQCINRMSELGVVTQLADEDDPTTRQEQLKEVDALFSGLGATDENAIQFSASEDPGALHRVEWIHFAAAFFNQEALSNKYFDEASQRVSCEIDSVAGDQPVPLVAWVDLFDDVWTISTAGYQMSLTRDAGGVPLMPVVTSFTNLNDLHLALSGVDVLIDISFQLTNFDMFLNAYGLNQTSDLKFVKNKQVWRVDHLQNKNDGWDWFESGIAQADAVLQDLISILHSTEHKRFWFRNSADDGVIILDSECADYKATLEPRADVCVEDSAPGRGGYSGGAIALALFGGVALGTGFVLVAIYMYRYLKSKKPKGEHEPLRESELRTIQQGDIL